MLPRIAAAFVSFGLLTAPALAGSFASAPPQDPPAAMPMPPIDVELPPVEVAPTKAEVLKALKARRAKNLKSFTAYRKGGVYPHNTVRRGPLNVWLDSDGHLCAAATMMDKDGKHELVYEVARTNNYQRLMDVTEGPLLDWIMTSGFTIEEIDQIQAPMIEPDYVIDYSLQDQRLAEGYARTEKALVKKQKASLELAAKRLLENPHLARQLVDGKV
ncbi:MAG TPA: hypothetical protein VL326_06645 [Kofleriaceae bacterium]|jgi:hypothetical protein|nr:hypothetical protein [Kofleriaceae bacterium]